MFGTKVRSGDSVNCIFGRLGRFQKAGEATGDTDYHLTPDMHIHICTSKSRIFSTVSVRATVATSPLLHCTITTTMIIKKVMVMVMWL